MSNIIKGNRNLHVFEPDLVDLSSLGAIIPGELIQAREEARNIIQRAREEAEIIRKRAERALIEAIEEKKLEKIRGFEEGRQEGFSGLTERIVQAEVERERILAGQETELIQMVMEIAKKIVVRELEKGAIIDIVRDALDKAVGDRVVVRVHPADKKQLEKNLASLADSSRVLKIQEDSSIVSGGCLVETELGTVDARLETQWAAIRKALGLSEGE
ncbi:MAG: hypothetical protein HYT76_06060 [Deltaproteobacteria bacterium]|nr:hypothetical protein [Deltaproteobacteria bacterium]